MGLYNQNENTLMTIWTSYLGGQIDYILFCTPSLLTSSSCLQRHLNFWLDSFFTIEEATGHTAHFLYEKQIGA